MFRHLFLHAFLLATVSTITKTEEPRARACLAIAAIKQKAPVKAPAVQPAKVEPKVSCPCSDQCTCGCNEGKPCTCGNAAPTSYAPPPQAFVPFFRSNASNCSS